MKNNPDKMTFIVAVVGTIFGVLFIVWIVAQMFVVRDEVERATAQQYDLNCLTEPIEKPLTDCKQD